VTTRVAAAAGSEIHLAARLAAAPGLVRRGISTWDNTLKLPLRPLSLEVAYGDPVLLSDLGAWGASVAARLEVDVVVGAETAGVPLAAAVSLASGKPFAFVRKPGYRGHEQGEPAVRGADVAGKRVLLVEDAVWRGTAVEAFLTQLHQAGAVVVGLFCLIDMRDVADIVTPTAAMLPTDAISTYLGILRIAADVETLDRQTYELAVDAIVHHWADDDSRWALLDEDAS
jgi:orotate phosphoribosyltransferase